MLRGAKRGPGNYNPSAGRCTYHSPLESVRAEPALLPAAAEAKEAGAIVVVECCGRYDGVSRPFVLWWWRAAN
jgi:hypothetical protein